MRRFAAILFFCAAPLFCQSNSGELRLKVTDPDGLGVKASVQIVSQANQYRNTLTTNEQGRLDVRRLPYGIYELEISQPGFALTTASIDIHSSFPVDYTMRLLLPTVKQSLDVSAANTLIDPDQAGSVNQVGADNIQHRLSSIPGRSLQDLVNSQPGWLYEGNAILHPRGSEYQTQIRSRRHPAHRQPLAQLRPGNRSRRHPVAHHLHRRHPRRIRPQNGRRRRSQHRCAIPSQASMAMSFSPAAASIPPAPSPPKASILGKTPSAPAPAAA